MSFVSRLYSWISGSDTASKILNVTHHVALVIIVCGFAVN